jgi:hypothetical protein
MAKGAIKDVKSESTRTKTWTIVLYPESAPSNWRDIIDETHIEWIESPLHDKDLNGNGEPKKPHWHIVLIFGGVKSFEQVEELTKALNGPIPQKIHNTRSMVRYLAHLDNPDKVQYKKSEIVGHGGADVTELLTCMASEEDSITIEICQWVKKYNIIEYQDVIDYCIENERDRWFPIIKKSFVVSQYVKSQRHRKLEYKS